jgi:hypothetical protein
MALFDADPKLNSDAAATAANSLGAAGVTGVTGTGTKAVTDVGATLTGATVNELTPTLIANVAAATEIAQTACPAFTAGAATVEPGTAKAGEVVAPSTLALAQNSTLTFSPTNMVQGPVYFTIHALALGFTLTLANGGPAHGNLGTAIPASMTVPRIYCLYFDGTNLSYQGYTYGKARA